jgi:4a-hydroxytetrahydrobiopterin dehydratase
MTQTAPVNLSTDHCVPCEGGVEPLKRTEFAVYLEQVKDWQVIEEKSLQKEFTFKNFKEAIAFINRVAQVAESEGHHPDFTLFDFKKIKMTYTTHAIDGLSVNDFVMAMKTNEVVKQS